MSTVIAENAHPLRGIFHRHRGQADLKVHHLNNVALHIRIENRSFTERTGVLAGFRKGREACSMHAMAAGEELNGGP